MKKRAKRVRNESREKRMKPTTYRAWSLFAAVAAIMALDACQADEDTTGDNYPSDGMVSVASAIVEGMTTRGVEQASQIESFSLWITNENSSKYTYSNICFTGSNEAGWTPDKTPYWESRNSEVGLVAVSPSPGSGYATYNTEEKSFNVSVATRQEPTDTGYDFLVYENDSYTPNEDLEDGSVVLSFSHALSKLTFNIYMGDSFNNSDDETIEDPLTDATYGVDTSTNPISKVFIRGTTASGTCYLSDMTVSGEAVKGSTDDIYINAALNYVKPESDTDNGIATYECILIPQEVDALSIRFTIGNYTYRWQADESLTLEGGYNYEVNIVVGDNSQSWSTVLGEEETTEDDDSSSDGSDSEGSAKGYKVKSALWKN